MKLSLKLLFSCSPLVSLFEPSSIRNMKYGREGANHKEGGEAEDQKGSRDW